MTVSGLVLDNLEFSFERENGEKLFDGLSGSIPLRGVTLVLGKNAAGKTALARLIAGFDRPERGKILWPAAGPAESVSWSAPRAGVVLEEPEFQLQTFELRDEMSIGLLHCGASQAERERRVEQTAALLGLESQLDTALDAFDRAGKLAALCAAFVALASRLLVLDFSPLELEKGFRSRLFELARSGDGPALFCLSREAEDLALLLPQESSFLLERGRLTGFAPDPADRDLLARLENSGIRLPWYTPLSRELHSKGRLGRLLFPGAEAFREAVSSYAAHPGSSDKNSLDR